MDVIQYLSLLMPPPKILLSQEEFLEFERNSDEKHEYYKGEIFAMSGASYEHNVIEDNIRGELHNFLKGKECRSFGNNLRTSVRSNTLYTTLFLFVANLNLLTTILILC